MLEIVVIVFAALAALLHVYIFWMESFAWTTPAVRRTFGLSEQSAEATKEMAFNQGFYNLFLAVIAAVGAGFLAAGVEGIGLALVIAGCGSMAAAALVLLLSSPTKARAAVTQGAFPSIAAATAIVSMFA